MSDLAYVLQFALKYLNAPLIKLGTFSFSPMSFIVTTFVLSSVVSVIRNIFFD